MTAPLRRRSPRARARIVHLGLGAFARAHTAVYTEHAPGDAWGIAGFTGRTAAAAERLSAQDGLYHVLTRAADGDSAELITALVSAHDGARLDVLSAALAAPETSLVTITVTEAGYHLGADGRLDRGADVIAADTAALEHLLRAGSLDGAAVSSMPGRMALGLERRRRAHGGGLAIVSCDNLNGNGPATRAALTDLAGDVSSELRDWIDSAVTFVSTSVDRVTPATTPADVNTVEALTGYRDAAVVVTEPFSDWILSGGFPAGRPRWEGAGARFVDDIAPFERRKLWHLNGAHSLLAYAGRLAGHATVAEAARDPRLRPWVEQLWDEAGAALPDPNLDLDRYRAQVMRRFENPRIEHRLAQIAVDGSVKLRQRVLPVLAAARERGADGHGAVRAIAAWVGWLLRGSDKVADAAGPRLDAARRRATHQDPAPLLEVLDPSLAGDTVAVAQVRAAFDEMEKL
jgi:fructuronate reductase